MLPMFARAGAAMVPGASRLPFVGGGGLEIPDLTLVLSDVAIDRDRLAAYDRVCGFSLSDELPATYPHMLAFPLQLALMTDGSFPFPAIGLVHIFNRIVQHRPVGLGEKLSLRVWATPGHSSDSLSFLLDPRDGTAAAVLTGDTILGEGTTVVAYPDGDLRQYLASLERLHELGDATVLTGHGPELPHAGQAAAAYLAHRAQRLEQVRAALADLGPDASARAIVERVYADVDRAVWWAAELSVRAQLAYLRERG